MNQEPELTTVERTLPLILVTLLFLVAAAAYWGGVHTAYAKVDSQISDFGKTRVKEKIFICEDTSPAIPRTVRIEELDAFKAEQRSINE